MKKFIIFLLFTSIIGSGFAKPSASGTFRIDASKNAVWHNAVGLRYLEEHCYYAAVQEFKISLSLNPNSQSSAIVYNNLGRAYMELGFAKEAEDCFERALSLYGLNFDYYKNLTNCYVALGKAKQKIEEYKKSENPLDKVMLGLLYVQTGQKRAGMITLDSYCMSEPDLILTGGVREYLRDLTKDYSEE